MQLHEIEAGHIHAIATIRSTYKDLMSLFLSVRDYYWSQEQEWRATDDGKDVYAKLIELGHTAGVLENTVDELPKLIRVRFLIIPTTKTLQAECYKDDEWVHVCNMYKVGELYQTDKYQGRMPLCEWRLYIEKLLNNP